MANRTAGFWNLLKQMLVPTPLAPKLWTKPDDPDDYATLLDNEGFVVPSRWEATDLTRFPDIMADLAMLEKYLMPNFWAFNQKSSYYQSRYYYYQRIFLANALITTFISVVNSFVFAVGNSFDAKIIMYLTVLFPNFVMPEFLGDPSTIINIMLGILTTIVSSRATYYTLLSNYGEPRQRWAHYRRLTEELRMTYFKFLAHLGAFAQEGRIKNLRTAVLTLRQQEQEDGG
jgi:hypothetical protein